MISSRTLLAVMATAVGLGSEAATIPADLTFSGEYLFDDTGGSFVDASGSQSGTLFARIGGTDTTVSYVDDSVTAGTNPLAAVFTDHGGGAVGGGDGFGGTGSGSALFTFRPGLDEFRADTDQTIADGVAPFTVFNSSATVPYLVTMSLTYDHSVEATGFDAVAESDLELDLNGSSIRDAVVVSDTFYGNEIDDTFTGGFGGTVSDSGVFAFDFVLGPGDTATMEIDYSLEGATFFPGSSASGSITYLLSIDNVVAVPEPAVAVLAGVGGLIAASRRFRVLRQPTTN